MMEGARGKRALMKIYCNFAVSNGLFLEEKSSRNNFHGQKKQAL
jgi:hypothetical protein